MIQIIEGLPDNVVGIVAKGRVTNEDCDKILKPLMETSLKRHDKVRLYYEIGCRFPGAAWEDLPQRLGTPNSQWRRFDRWAKAGRWDPILAALRDPDLDVLILDSTAVRAHPCAAGAKKNGTGLAARTIRRWAAVGAGSGPRSTGASTASATRSS